LTFVICGLYPTLSGFICGLSYPKGVHYLSNIFNFVQIIVGSYHTSSPDATSSPFVSSPLSMPSSPLRRTTHTSQKPVYLREYQCQLAASSLPSSSISLTNGSSGIPYDLSSFLSYDKLYPSHDKHFSLTVSYHVFIKLLKIPFGEMLCRLQFQLLKRIILGSLLICHPTNTPQAVNGCLKLYTRLMAL